jgi:hypothetical protein
VLISVAIGAAVGFSAALNVLLSEYLDRGYSPTLARPLPPGAPPLWLPSGYRWAELGFSLALLVVALMALLGSRIQRARHGRAADGLVRQEFPEASRVPRERVRAVRNAKLMAFGQHSHPPVAAPVSGTVAVDQELLGLCWALLAQGAAVTGAAGGVGALAGPPPGEAGQQGQGHGAGNEAVGQGPAGTTDDARGQQGRQQAAGGAGGGRESGQAGSAARAVWVSSPTTRPRPDSCPSATAAAAGGYPLPSSGSPPPSSRSDPRNARSPRPQVTERLRPGRARDLARLQHSVHRLQHGPGPGPATPSSHLPRSPVFTTADHEYIRCSVIPASAWARLSPGRMSNESSHNGLPVADFPLRFNTRT